MVAVDARGEVLQQGARALQARRQRQGGQVGAGKAQLLQFGQALAPGRRRQVPGMRLHREGAGRVGVQLLQPGALVGREDAVGAALLGHDLVAVPQHLVLHVGKRNAQRRQRARHAGVAGAGAGLVVAAGQHLAHAQLAGQLHDALGRRPVAHDQAAARRAAAGRQLAQRAVQLRHAGVDELHAPVRARGQGLQDVGVVHEGAVHLGVAPQRLVQGRVVVAAQVAAEPHQRGAAL